MRTRLFSAKAVLTAAIIFFVWLNSAPFAGQNQESHSASFSRTGKPYTPPRTPDGQPELQGIWTNATITPLERPSEFASQAFLTESQAADLERRAADQRDQTDNSPRRGSVGTYNQFWYDSGTKVVSTKQTSLVVVPEDGRIRLTPTAEAKRDADLARDGDSYEFMSRWDRCITRGVPGSMLPTAYNNAYEIIQTPGYVVIRYEMIHDARVIPLDGRPHVNSKIRLWMGDARGHWEGRTLVVDTTNFNDKGWIASHAAAGRIRGIGQSEALHVVERFTRIDPDTILYEAEIDDPAFYTHSWNVAIPLVHDPRYQIFEYACHEGNYSVPNILSGARALDKAQREIADR